MIVRSLRQKLLSAVGVFLLIAGVFLFHDLVKRSPSQPLEDQSHAQARNPLSSTAPGQAILDAKDPFDHVDQNACETTPHLESGLFKQPPTFVALVKALDVMQSHFYTIWQGQWPSAIDWTAAVMGTQVSATLAAISETWRYRQRPHHRRSSVDQERENMINRYFTQITSFYFGENAFSLRTQAYDDMLWVVLGWLESIKFINMHSDLHYLRADDVSEPAQAQQRNTTLWYAQQFIPQFAHRARLFYDLASKGWDTSLCGGGMVWNPYLAPYKNAITNQLFISASISMYLYFPGDCNSSPFSIKNPVRASTGLPPAKAHDPQYLENAVEAYQWLKTSGMRNGKGLYVDGFHVQGWRGGKNGSTGTGQCDLRDNQVYTYNQGVILSGLRGLWEATGSKEYLEDAHQLVRNVIDASGWQTRGTRWQWRWSGLGRNGVMEEACDSTGTCSQNGHTFKGIFFHHLALLCSDLPEAMRSEESFQSFSADDALFAWHRARCDDYGPWLKHNAQAASVTRDEEGRFGTWWGIPGGNRQTNHDDMTQREGFDLPPDEGTDYRNEGVPIDMTWRLPDDQVWQFQNEMNDDRDESAPARKEEKSGEGPSTQTFWDPNDRGRGRTVETQSGGLAVLRALWKIVEMER
ncbi:MAG: hypothetical protein Q9183_004222 [Haloplaca sp. 2 TL-2023]